MIQENLKLFPVRFVEEILLIRMNRMCVKIVSTIVMSGLKKLTLVLCYLIL